MYEYVYINSAFVEILDESHVITCLSYPRAGMRQCIVPFKVYINYIAYLSMLTS